MRGGHPGWLLLNVWRPEVPMPMAVAPRVLENAAAAAVRLANWNPSGQHLGPHRFGAVHAKRDYIFSLLPFVLLFGLLAFGVGEERETLA